MKCHANKWSQWSECTVDIAYRLECHAVSSAVDETSRHWHLGRISPLPTSIAMQPQTARSAQKLLQCTDTVHVDVDLQRFNETPHWMHSYVYPSPITLTFVVPCPFRCSDFNLFSCHLSGGYLSFSAFHRKKTCHDV
jgi:hypothetical protein